MTSDYIDSDGFRANVGIILSNADGKVLLAGRVGGRGWQFPQGGMLEGESATDAMFRELHEEVGLAAADVEVLGNTDDWLRYRLPQKFVRRNSEPLCIGQKQRWFMLRLVSDEDRLRFDRSESPEFDRWRWVEFWHPVKEVIYFKRRVYARGPARTRTTPLSGRFAAAAALVAASAGAPCSTSDLDVAQQKNVRRIRTA